MVVSGNSILYLRRLKHHIPTPRAKASYVLELPYSNDRELLMDILKHASSVQVLQPASLKKRVRDEIAAMQACYT